MRCSIAKTMLTLLAGRRSAILLIVSTLGIASPAWAGGRQVKIDNGVLHVTVDLPDPVNGAYRGTRFDWSGVIQSLSYAGHDYYGPWFTATDPTVHDFVFSGDRIIAGPCSAITGPVEEFVSGDSALGYDGAAPGGTFVKIGVGVLEKPSDAPYDNYHLYRIVDGGRWTVRPGPQSVTFEQRILDPHSGYGYVYEKTLRLIPGRPEMVIEHSLRNTGRQTIDTDVYDHNFLVLDHRTIGPDFVITLPFAVHVPKPVNAALGEIDGNTIRYRRELQGHEDFAADLRGFGPAAKDYDIRIENARAGAGMRVQGDHPLAKLELWSIRTIIAMEPFIHISIAPGEAFHWQYRYEYYSIPAR